MSRKASVRPSGAAEAIRYAPEPSVAPGAVQQPKRGKYGNRAVTVAGVRFASQWEAERFWTLQQRERAGKITDLEPHPVFPLVVNGVKVGRYTADARYRVVATGEVVVEDAKSPATKTTAYKLRKLLVRACHGIEITEVERR